MFKRSIKTYLRFFNHADMAVLGAKSLATYHIEGIDPDGLYIWLISANKKPEIPKDDKITLVSKKVEQKQGQEK